MARPKDFEPDVVLDRVVDVFRDRGFSSASLGELTERSGVGRQSLYDTFGSKQQLWSLALARYRHRQGEAMLRFLDEADDEIAGIRAMLYWLVEDTCADPRGCLVVTAATEMVPTDGATTEQVRVQFQAIVDALEVAVRRGQASGRIRHDVDAVASAELLLTVMQGLRVTGKVRGDRDRMHVVVEQTLMALVA